MRYLAAFLLLAAPLGAQAPVIAPAPSVLFATSSPEALQDTIEVDDGMPQGQGAFLGLLGGAGIGFLLGKAVEGGNYGCATLAGSGGGCGGSDPAKTRLQMAVAGGLVGLFVGSSLAGPHAPHLTFAPATRADSLVLARRKGGKVGALVGGLIAGGAVFVATRGRGDPTCDFDPCSGGGDSFDGIPVLMATGAGALAGYLIGRSIPARRANSRPLLEADHPPVHDTGMKWWQGAALGGIVGGVGVPILVNTFRLNQDGDGVPAVAFAPVGALLGLVIGGSLAQAH